MFLENQHPDGGMRPLPPPEEGDHEAPMRIAKQLTLSAKVVFKTPHSKPKSRHEDVRGLTKTIEDFADNEHASAKDALKVIEESRGTIFKILKEKSARKNKKNKSKGRHNSPHTSKKLPPKYGMH